MSIYKKDSPTPYTPISFSTRGELVDTRTAYEKIVNQHGDPLYKLAEIAFDEVNPIDLRLGALKDLIKYGHAQRKAVEISGPNGGALEIDVRSKLINDITQSFEKLAAK